MIVTIVSISVQDVYRQLQDESLKWNYCLRFVESVIIYCVATLYLLVVLYYL